MVFLQSRPLISHVFILAVGFALGIFIARGGSESRPPTELQCVGGSATTIESSGFPGGNSSASPPGRPRAAATPVRVASDDPVLLKWREDYKDQIRRNEQRQALLILQEMEKKAPLSKVFLETNSEYQIYTKDWRAAAAAAQKCVAAFPKSQLCFRNLATAELQDGGTDEQAAAVNSCLALEPNDPQCRNMLGMVQMNGGDYTSAIATYEKLIRDNGSYGVQFNDAQLEWRLGLALEGAGRREQAIDHLEYACRRHKNEACRKIEEISGGGMD